MNANSKPAAPSDLNDWLRNASQRLAEAGIPTARLDAELILAHVLGAERTWLIAHGDEAFPATPAGAPSCAAEETAPERACGGETDLVGDASALLAKRLEHTPLAYLLGRKEFYGRNFTVTPNVLIPRPESEMLIEMLRKQADGKPGRLCDVGTGSGCLAITAKLELPQLSVTACDISPAALLVTTQNTVQLGAQIDCVQSDLLGNIDGTFEYIVANLPYVDREWERSPETDHEPALALFADGGGLNLICQLIEQAPSRLAGRGYLLLEADPIQHPAIIDFAAKHHFKAIDRKDYAVLLEL